MKQSHKLFGLERFLLLWSSQAVSTLGSAMTNYALIIWVYRQKGTATSITLLAFCSYLPSILFSFVAGTLADKWDKRKIMLVGDLVAALCTLGVFVLFKTNTLQIWHLYAINFLNSLMNAFQYPASNVAVSLIAPKEQYARVSGMQSFSSALVTILTPALATAVLSFAGLEAVFIIDLASFAVAFSMLLFFIRIPSVATVMNEKKESFLQDCLSGLRFIKKQKALLKIILYMALINLLAYITGYGLLPAMILARSGDNQTTLGLVSSAVGVGTLVGSILVTILKPAKNKTRVIFLSLAISFFLCDILWSFERTALLWVLSAFAGHISIPFLNAYLTTIMRTKVPIEMQGRVFSTRDTLQFFSIPVGLILGGFLADNVFEPFMMAHSPIQQMLAMLFGEGHGAGMAVIFFISGVIGCGASLLCLRDKGFLELND